MVGSTLILRYTATSTVTTDLGFAYSADSPDAVGGTTSFRERRRRAENISDNRAIRAIRANAMALAGRIGWRPNYRRFYVAWRDVAPFCEPVGSWAGSTAGLPAGAAVWMPALPSGGRVDWLHSYRQPAH